MYGIVIFTICITLIPIVKGILFPFFFSVVVVLFLGANSVGLAENYRIRIPDPFVAIVTIHA